MARPREFDEAEALDKAMELFWRKGYAETSMRDLAAFTGVSHAGLYTTFGDKRELFKRTLLLYDRQLGDALMGALEEPDSGRTAIEAFFYTLLGFVAAKQFKNGCLMCNTLVEFGDETGDILSLARRNIDRMTAAFEGALARAVKKKEARRDLDPGASAAFFTAVFHGVAVLARAQAPLSRIRSAVETALRQLD